MPKPNFVGLFIEQPLAVVLAGKLPDEPIRQTRDRPAVRMQDPLLRNVLAHAVPFQGGLAADVQTVDFSLQQTQTRI